MGCQGYTALARMYEQLNRRVNYRGYADYIEKQFAKWMPENQPSLVLDLACGTGTLTRMLASRGYDMIGVDGSADMLSVAMTKGTGKGTSPILYLCQDMSELELYGTVGATVCTLDSINYLLDGETVKKVFLLVHNYLDPNGLFVFDINTPYRFAEIYGNHHYILEDKKQNFYCGWQNYFSTSTKLCDFELDLFEKQQNGEFKRYHECQTERCYSLRTVKTYLKETGFEVLDVDQNVDGEPIPQNEKQHRFEKYYVTARCIKE